MSAPKTRTPAASSRNDRGERLILVADGMGGHRGGATASRLCVEAVGRAFELGEGLPDERLREGLDNANREVREAGRGDDELAGMGTTAVAMIFEPDGPAWLAWVGDSRAYRFRSGRLQMLTRDHSVVAEWVRLGVISEDEAETHPRRSELLRAIGGADKVEIEVRRVEVLPGDRFLLCSDGLCGFLPEPDIAAALGFDDPDAAVKKLVHKVNDEHGGPDNVTVQIAAVPAPQESGAPAIDWTELRPPARRSPRPWLVGSLAAVVVAVAGASWFALRGGGDSPLPAVGAGQPVVVTPDQFEERRRIAEVRSLQEGEARRQRREQADERAKQEAHAKADYVDGERVVEAPPPLLEFGKAGPTSYKPKPKPKPVPKPVASKPEPQPEVASGPPQPSEAERIAADLPKPMLFSVAATPAVEVAKAEPEAVVPVPEPATPVAPDPGPEPDLIKVVRLDSGEPRVASVTLAPEQSALIAADRGRADLFTIPIPVEPPAPELVEPLVAEPEVAMVEPPAPELVEPLVAEPEVAMVEPPAPELVEPLVAEPRSRWWSRPLRCSWSRWWPSPRSRCWSRPLRCSWSRWWPSPRSRWWSRPLRCSRSRW